MTVTIKDFNNEVIDVRKWCDVYIPQPGDTLSIPVSKDSDDTYQVIVLKRIIRVNCPTDVVLITDYKKG